jgi:DNA-binding IclR family transcriptional regulator
MVRSALSANRAIAIIDWIVSHSDEVFTLSELSRALDINVPSAMSVLQSLTDAGYLLRQPGRKTYEAGPALLAIGLVASRHHPAFKILDRELELLANSVGTECFAVIAVSEQFVNVAEAGRPGAHSMPVHVGLRFPFMAPVGHVNLAWSPLKDIEAWVRRADGPDTKMDLDRIQQELALVRSLGYCAMHYQGVDYRPSEALEKLTGAPNDPSRQEAVRAAVAKFGENWEVLQPKPGMSYDVSNLTAPVFDSKGKVLMSIILNGFGRIEGSEVLAHAERLLQTTRLLTKIGNGQFPAKFA